MSAVFDDISRIVASPLSRRRAVKLIVSRMAAAALFLHWDQKTAVAGVPGRIPPPDCDPQTEDSCVPETDRCCPKGYQCCDAECCELDAFEECCSNSLGRHCCPAFSCCSDSSAEPFCCPNGTSGCCYGTLGTACCNPDLQDCCDGKCLSKNLRCRSVNGFDRGECEPCNSCCIGFAIFACCGPEEKCCPGKTALCCQPSKPACCTAAASGVNDCCVDDEHCCMDPGGMRAVCCDPNDCVNGVCVPRPVAMVSGGGGKLISESRAVSTLRFSISGRGLRNENNLHSFSAVEGESPIVGSLEAFGYRNRTRVQSASFTDIVGSVEGDDISLVAFGSADVNGTLTQIIFRGTKTNGLIDFTISNRASGKVIISGTGESGRAALALTISPL